MAAAPQRVGDAHLKASTVTKCGEMKTLGELSRSNSPKSLVAKRVPAATELKVDAGRGGAPLDDLRVKGQGKKPPYEPETWEL